MPLRNRVDPFYGIYDPAYRWCGDARTFLGLAVRGFVVWRNALRSVDGMRP